MCVNIDDCLNELSENVKLAVGAPRQYVLHSSSFSRNEIFCFDYGEHIESRQASVLIRRDFGLFPLINNQILALSEHGLIEKWSADYRMKKTARNDFVSTYKYLLLGHLVSLGYFFLLPGYALAATAFALELLARGRRVLDTIVSGQLFRLL